MSLLAARTPFRAVAAVALAFAALVPPAPRASAAWQPAGVDLARPRILLRGADLPAIQARLEREPYAAIARAMARRTALADDLALDDHTINAQRIKSRAAKNLAFFYAVDRLPSDGGVARPTAEERDALAERVRDLLVNLYPRSRLAAPAPLGGWDRDISSSEELLQWATAYDAMRGAGYDFGADDATIVERIAALAGELYENYVFPETAGGSANLHQNNHRSKVGAALVLAAIAIAEYQAPAGSDPRGVREPRAWLEYGLDQVDLVMRYALVAHDGAYGEGPFYMRFAAQNLFPFARAWDRLVSGAAWRARGVDVPSLLRHPSFLRGQRWMLDLTLPDGALAPIDDGNPGRSYYFGAAPAASPELAAAFAWRWTEAPARFETDGNVDLGADAILAYDDAVVPAPPPGSPTAFWIEGGNAVFRSDWSRDAVLAIVQGERDAAAEFGRDRDGLGVSPQSHEHAEPGAFLLHAFGELLALDPGYFSFPERTLVNKPEDHNLVLVDGRGPVDYLQASVDWQRDLRGPPPADGQATLAETIDTAFVDAATVRSRYGQPVERAATIERRFLFVADRTLVIADTASGPDDPPAAFTWLLHGNAGGSEGAFTASASGGRWTRDAARLDTAISTDVGPASFASALALHEGADRARLEHVVLRATASGREVRSVQIVHPTRSDAAAPSAIALDLEGVAAVALADDAGDRRMLALHRAAATPGSASLAVRGAASGLRDAATDGDLAVFDAARDGTLRRAWAEGATRVLYDGRVVLAGSRPGLLGLEVGPDRASAIVDDGSSFASVPGLPFTPRAADGACAFATSGGTTIVRLGRERRFTLRADAGNSAPGADPGPDRVVGVGERVALDATRSCDADGDALTARWELVAAPPDDDWALGDADTLRAELTPDAPGTYRIRLVVTDARGAASLERELVVRAETGRRSGVATRLPLGRRGVGAGSGVRGLGDAGGLRGANGGANGAPAAPLAAPGARSR